jgi:transcriptional regulator with XRE-family HTH domain
MQEVTILSQRRASVRSGSDLGLAVAEIRRTRNMTQDQVAEAFGFTRSYVAHIERGRTTSLLEKQLDLIRRMGGTITVTWDA